MKKTDIEGEKQMLHTQIILHSRLFKNVIEGIKKEDQIQRASKSVNHMAWLAGSFISTRYFMLEQLGTVLNEPYPELFQSNKAIDEALSYPDLETQYTHLGEVTDRLSQALQQATLEQLNTETQIDFGVTKKTVFGLLIFLIDRESYLIGQMAFMRKLFGYPAMGYQ